MTHLTTETYILDIKQPFNLIQKMLQDLTENEIKVNDFIEGVDVVGATCVDINAQRRFEELNFDVVIIDEVGQIHNALVPLSLSRGKKIGEHKQIPSIVKEEVLAEAL